MAKFASKTILAIKGIQTFRQLIILKDRVDSRLVQAEINRMESLGINVALPGQLDIYEASLEEKYKSSFARILGNMDRVSNLKMISNDKFKIVSNSKSKVTEYEYKYGDLRILSIKIPNGQMIVLGGYKNDQRSAFREFRQLVKEFLTFVNNNK
ncbi:MAG: hypothetical protein ABWZ25_12460 [Chitinophagaceae bacterium]